MRFAIDSASPWSWVTKTKVMPSDFCSALQLLLHVFAQLQIERAERLVEQQHLRPVDQRAGERDALALAAGELARPARAVARQLDHFERGLRLALALGLADALDHQAVGDVVEHVQMREERVVLEDRVDVAPVGRDALGALAENLDAAGCRLLEAGDQAQAGGLARAGWSEHGEELALADVEVDGIDGPDRAEVARHLLEGDGWGHLVIGTICNEALRTPLVRRLRRLLPSGRGRAASSSPRERRRWRAKRVG